MKILLTTILLLLSLSASASQLEGVLLYPQVVRIIILGDEFISSVNVGKMQSFPYVLERHIRNTGRKKIQIIPEFGENYTSLDGVRSLPKIQGMKPDIVVLMLGANDLKQHIDPKETYKNLGDLVKLLTEKKINVILVGIKPGINEGDIYKEKYPKIYDYLAYKYKLPYYKSLFEGLDKNPQLVNKDGSVNDFGMEYIAEAIAPVMLPTIDKVMKENNIK